MPVVHLGVLAELDLADIWSYSAARWGEEQAEEYLDSIGLAVEQLATYPEAGTRRDSVREGYRVLFVGSHAVYYRLTVSTVWIVRVLHERMDPFKHL